MFIIIIVFDNCDFLQFSFISTSVEVSDVILPESHKIITHAFCLVDHIFQKQFHLLLNWKKTSEKTSLTAFNKIFLVMTFICSPVGWCQGRINLYVNQWQLTWWYTYIAWMLLSALSAWLIHLFIKVFFLCGSFG